MKATILFHNKNNHILDANTYVQNWDSQFPENLLNGPKEKFLVFKTLINNGCGNQAIPLYSICGSLELFTLIMIITVIPVKLSSKRRLNILSHWSKYSKALMSLLR